MNHKLIEKYIKKYLGKKNNPLNMMTFKEIEEFALQKEKECRNKKKKI